MRNLLEAILLEQAKRYPLMEPTDAVKLIYQNEFGAGHFIKDEKACLEHLRREYEQVEKCPGQLRYEAIGNGLCRAHLAALEEWELDALGEAFLRCAACHRGTMDGFLEKLSVLSELVAKGAFSFGSAAFSAYLEEYKSLGCPPVSHSEAYRKAYHPAYRVVLMEKE